ncbi:MAG: hypothetical protein K2I87_03215, partial [Bacteroidales bacterium]|nr:hypothetical protein [Bacteroidales bacterium]
VMVSCDKPEKGNAENGSTEITGASGKMLVKKMTAKGTLVYNYNDDDDYYDYDKTQASGKADATFTFTYADGRMTRLSASGGYTYVSDREFSHNGEVQKQYYEDNASGSGNLAFTYNGDVVNVKIDANGKVSGKRDNGPDENDDNYVWLEEGNISGDYTLNMSNGAAVSGQGTFKEDGGSYTTDKVKFEYDNNNQLTSLYYEGEYEYRTEFKWENGNMVNVGWYDDDDYKKAGKRHNRMPFGKKQAKAAKSSSIEWNDRYRVEYSTKENKGNIDLARILFVYMGEYYEQFIGVFGFLGKESKNLPSKIYFTNDEWNEETGEYEKEEVVFLSMEYDFNGNGTVKRIKISCPTMTEEEYDTTATIEFEY